MLESLLEDFVSGLIVIKTLTANQNPLDNGYVHTTQNAGVNSPFNA